MTLKYHPAGTPAEDPSARIIFIHGLVGHYRETWTSHLGGFWPAWIQSIFTDAAVYSVEYAAGLTAFKDPGQSVEERATSMLDSLSSHGFLDGKPLVFIAHSMGGLLVKRMLHISHAVAMESLSRKANKPPGDEEAANYVDKVDDRLAVMWRETRGVLFLATPHIGSSLATWLSRVGILASAATESLAYASQNALQLHGWYHKSVLQAQPRRIITKVYYEARRTFAATIVPRESANMAGVENVPVDSDHILIAKPPCRDSAVFRGTVEFLCNTLNVPTARRNALLQAIPGLDAADALSGPAPVPGSRRVPAVLMLTASLFMAGVTWYGWPQYEVLPQAVAACPAGQMNNAGGCVSRCAEGMVFIAGTHEYEFVVAGTHHEVGDFCLDVTEVTVAAFRSLNDPKVFESTKIRDFKGVNDPGNVFCNARYEDRGQHPINCVDWHQATEHCRRAGGRLPTEWEWRWVARGRDKGWRFPWGDTPEPTCLVAVMDDGGRGCKQNRTSPVGSRERHSRDQIKDLSGNVWEWSQGSDSDGKRALHGGGWFNEAKWMEAGSRLSNNPTGDGHDFGFRCAGEPR